jgi:hypothetical protein
MLTAIDSETLWLNVANGALGIAALLFCLAIVGAVIYEFVVRAHRRTYIIQNADAALRILLHPPRGPRRYNDRP